MAHESFKYIGAYKVVPQSTGGGLLEHIESIPIYDLKDYSYLQVKLNTEVRSRVPDDTILTYFNETDPKEFDGWMSEITEGINTDSHVEETTD